MAENCEVNHSCIHLNGGQEKRAVKRRVWQSGALSPSWWMGHFLQPSSTQVSITAGDLGLRANWVHGQFPGTLRWLNGVLHKCWPELHKLRSERFSMALTAWLLCFLSSPFGTDWFMATYYPPFLQENITFRNNGEWICSQFPLKPVQGLWEIMQMRQVCKDVFRVLFYAFLTFEVKSIGTSVSFSPTRSKTCII